MDYKKLPEKLLRQSYFMAYNEILNFLHIIKIFYFLIFNFFGGESENKKINKSYIILMYRFIIMNILISYILYYAFVKK